MMLISDHNYQYTGRVTELDSKVWSLHVNVPYDIVDSLKKAGIKRLVCTYNGREANHCALMSHGEGHYFILLNQERARRLGLGVGSPVDMHISEDSSTYGMPMPKEMAELLRQDPQADRYFHALSPGKQRSLLYIIGKPKGSDTRLKKAIGICEYLKDAAGTFDFREMNEALKQSRFKRD